MQEWRRFGPQGRDYVHEIRGKGAWIIGGEAVGDGVEVESRESGGEGLALGELAVVVLGVEEGDVDAGVAEKLRQG